MGIQVINIGTVGMDQNADNLREGMDKVNANFAELDLFKAFIMPASTDIIAAHKNATLFVSNNVNLTLKTDLPAAFGCIIKMRETADFTCNILAGKNVTLEPANPVLTKGKMCSIIRYPNSDTFIISGEI